MSVLLVHALCLCSITLLHVHAICRCRMSLLHFRAACSCCISMLFVHVACPSCISMLHVRTTCPLSMLYKFFSIRFIPNRFTLLFPRRSALFRLYFASRIYCFASKRKHTLCFVVSQTKFTSVSLQPETNGAPL